MNVIVPFNQEEMLDGDCLLSGEFSVPATNTLDEMKELVAKHYLSEESTYEEFVEEYNTPINGYWLIDENVHKKIINSVPSFGNDSAMYAAIGTMKNMIDSFGNRQLIS